MDSFDPDDTDHQYLRMRCEAQLADFNLQPATVSEEERTKAWLELVSPDVLQANPNIDVLGLVPTIRSPFHVDYGVRIHIAPSATIHRDCYIADNPHKAITIGERTVVGARVTILTVQQTLQGKNQATEVTIGEDCYVGAGAIVLPGVVIGRGCTVGAGAVVSSDVPAGSVVMRNAAQTVRSLAHGVSSASDPAYEGWRTGMIDVLDELSSTRTGSVISGQAVETQRGGIGWPLPSSQVADAEYKLALTSRGPKLAAEGVGAVLLDAVLLVASALGV